MYAIVDFNGKQYKVEQNTFIYTHRVDAEEGAQIEMSNVLLIDNNGAITVGTPTIEGATIKAKILGHLKDDKVLIFKKKRRKGYKKSQGHRQYLSKVLIESIAQ